jgi:hypothetical protein
MILQHFIPTTEASALRDDLHDRMIHCGEVIASQHSSEIIAAFEVMHACRLTPQEILYALWHAADDFVDSMVSNEHDTEEEGRTDIEPLADRLARWERFRPEPLRRREILSVIGQSGFQTPPAPTGALAATPSDPVTIYYCKAGIATGQTVRVSQGKSVTACSGVRLEAATGIMLHGNSTGKAKASGARCVLELVSGSITTIP